MVWRRFSRDLAILATYALSELIDWHSVAVGTPSGSIGWSASGCPKCRRVARTIHLGVSLLSLNCSAMKVSFAKGDHAAVLFVQPLFHFLPNKRSLQQRRQREDQSFNRSGTSRNLSIAP
jgi:hypothetical protein